MHDAPNAVSLGRLPRQIGYYALGGWTPQAIKKNANSTFRRAALAVRRAYPGQPPPHRPDCDFQSEKGLTLSENHLFNDEEYNTYACPWHHKLTAAIVSFRTAKALKSNSGSTYDIDSFRWHNSTEFEWHSQLLDLADGAGTVVLVGF
ncbi:hypothetical protein [Celeribacter baekdonensis]|uniref:hypothetical protein n=1 Tax=Celeribacter baekdonensis TaxID=875171 RepID=UPI0026AA4410